MLENTFCIYKRYSYMKFVAFPFQTILNILINSETNGIYSSAYNYILYTMHRVLGVWTSRFELEVWIWISYLIPVNIEGRWPFYTNVLWAISIDSLIYKWGQFYRRGHWFIDDTPH